jgi:hypothetical protein
MPNLSDDALQKWWYQQAALIQEMASAQESIETWTLDCAPDVKKAMAGIGAAASRNPVRFASLLRERSYLRAFRMTLASMNVKRRLRFLAALFSFDRSGALIETILAPPFTEESMPDDLEEASRALIAACLESLHRRKFLAEMFSQERLRIIQSSFTEER